MNHNNPPQQRPHQKTNKPKMAAMSMVPQDQATKQNNDIDVGNRSILQMSYNVST